MAELRSVDPRILQPNPNNPRTTPVPPAMDEQLLASIKAVGIIQPPCVTPNGDKLMIAVGNRRVKAAIKADLPVIDVLVCDADEAAAAMRAVAENLIRASMSSVDIWRAIERLEAQGWNEQAIADALALPARTVRRLKLLAHLHPPMLDVMALGSMPNEEQLRTIAAATRDEQAQVWKKHKPKKGQPEVAWYEIARALAKRRMPASAAKFGDDLAKRTASFGRMTCSPHQVRTAATPPTSRVLRCPAGVAAEQFAGARHLLPVNDYGQGQLPKKAERATASPARAILSGTTSTCEPARWKPSPTGCPSRRRPANPRMAAGPQPVRLMAAATRRNPCYAHPAGRDAEGCRDDRRSAHRGAASGAGRHADRGRYPARHADPRVRLRQRLRRLRQRSARRRSGGDCRTSPKVAC